MSKATKEEIIEIQKQHLAEWSMVLRPECMKKLSVWAQETNEEVTDPYRIRRGTDLDQFVQNLKKHIYFSGKRR